MKIDKLKEKIIERYKTSERIEEGFYLRIRENETSVYYNGIQTFILNNKDLKLNISVFVPNTKNVFENSKKIKSYVNIPTNVKEDSEFLDKFFKITISPKNKNIKLPFSTKESLDIKRKEEIFDQVKETIDKSIFDEPKIADDKKNILLPLKDNKVKNMDFKTLYDIKYKFLDFTNDEKYKTNKKPDLQSVKYTLNCKLMKDNIDFDELDKIMKRRINVYIGQDSYNNEKDYKKTKSDTNQEKKIQQSLTTKINNPHEDIKLTNGEILFSSRTYPFEMEYNIYAGHNKKKETDDMTEEEKENVRSRASINGRIDNVFIDGNKILLTEVKYGTSVISGSNGIHKHLIDMYMCLKLNRNDIVKDFNRFITERNKVLKNGKSFKFEDNDTFEYYIICFYNNKEVTGELSKDNVKSELESWINKPVNEIKELFSYLEGNNKIAKNNKEIISSKKYDENLINKNVYGLIKLLKEDCNCNVKIIIASLDDNKYKLYC